MSRQHIGRATRELIDTILVLDFADAPTERHPTPLPAVVWAPTDSEQNQRGKVDHATPKTRLLRQMREGA